MIAKKKRTRGGIRGFGVETTTALADGHRPLDDTAPHAAMLGAPTSPRWLPVMIRAIAIAHAAPTDRPARIRALLVAMRAALSEGVDHG